MAVHVILDLHRPPLTRDFNDFHGYRASKLTALLAERAPEKRRQLDRTHAKPPQTRHQVFIVYTESFLS